MFDNGLEKSRVLELNPLTFQIAWQYDGDGLGRPFYSSWGGSNQRLPNGNTLITETATGYGFEVTPDGEIVWQFANPEVDKEGKRTNLWRMTRFAKSELGFL